MDGIGTIGTHYFCAMPKNNIQIGHLIQAQLEADKRSVSWLAREIGCTRNHLYKIFNKPSLDSDLLLRISKAMQFNFFQFYAAEVLKEMKNRLGE
jgi:DNA-binding phage protein